jgi:mannosyltransferase
MNSTVPAHPKWYVYGMAGVVLLGFGLRLFRLMDQSLWYDEAFDVLFAQGTLDNILAGAKNDTMPPLHYLLLHAWMWLGAGEFVVKLFPVWLGVLATAVAYPLGRRLLDPHAALGGALLTALSPFQVHYAREVRMYSQLLLFGTLSVLFLVRCMDGCAAQGAGHRLRRWADRTGLVGFTTLAVYTHTLGFLTPLSVGAAALVLGWRDRRFVRRLLAGGVAVVLLATPWLLFVLPGQVSRVVSVFWVARPSVLAPLVTLHMFLAGYAVPPAWMPAALLVTLSVTAVALYRALRALIHRGTNDLVVACSEGKPPVDGSEGTVHSPSSGVARQRLALLLAWLLGPICLVWLLSLFAPMYLDRLFITSGLALYLLVAWGLARVPRGLGYTLGALLVGVVALSLGHYYLNPAYHKPPMRAAAAYVADAALPGDVVLHTSDGSLLPFAYYQPRLKQSLVAGDPEHRPGTARAQSLRLLGYAPVKLEQALDAPAQVWLVVALDHSVEFQTEVLRQIRGVRVLSSTATIGGIQVYLLAESNGAP